MPHYLEFASIIILKVVCTCSFILPRDIHGTVESKIIQGYMYYQSHWKCQGNSKGAISCRAT